MSMFKEEFLKAARETPRMFFAPIVGAVEAVRREFKVLGKDKEKDKEKDDKVLVIHVRTFRRFRKAAHKARKDAVASRDKIA
ncbi:hypothetical protein PMI36_05549 [Pseudomonas sp. GM79]|uniref:hypothetical protein n=1 Tax=Pseudomonas sp. GM79 TaxID=1144338 RepID=UPI00026F7CA0|nr:hypothetical protein [Pseudomonas sp. GM79]EJN17215.1 hypothetical protein PMI36_05549 [Pseudomonas sp. GM79]